MKLFIPKFSVVIASHGRVELLMKLLESLNLAKSLTTEYVEILVVDSTPKGKAASIHKICNELGAILINGPLSVRCKRNLGAHSATGEWLLFVDSDCQVTQEIFNIYCCAIDSNPEFLAMAGPTVFQDGETWFTKLIHNSSLLSPFRQPANEKNLLWATTSNLLVRKDIFDFIKGFREDFPYRLGGDDTDFCLRLRDASYKIISVSEAICFHSWTTWSHPISIVRRAFRWGWMHSILLREHPRYRRIDAPSLPAHTLVCILIALIGVAITGYVQLLVVPVLFVTLAVMFHALFMSLRATKPLLAFFEDIALAIVELPFGFGRIFGSLSSGSLIGMFFRLDVDDVAAYKVFPETVCALWCDYLAFMSVALFIGWTL